MRFPRLVKVVAPFSMVVVAAGTRLTTAQETEALAGRGSGTAATTA